MTFPRILRSICVCSALLFSAASVGAQFTVTGAGCAGESGAVASIQGSGFPTVGSTYSIDISGAPNVPGLIGIGVTPIPSPGFDLTSVGLPGCTLDLLILSSVGIVTDGAGEFSITAPPPTVAGSTFFLQAYLIDAGPTTLGATTELLQVTSIPASGFSAGEVIVTEFIRDPATISDSDGEWVEIFNTTANDIDIEGWYIADDDFDFALIDVGGAGVTVPAGGFAVLGVNADTTVNGGVTLDYQWSSFYLSNTTAASGDEIRLIDFSGLEIDRVAYSVPGGWPLQGGKSCSLDPGSFDATSNDDPANWCLEATIYDTTAGVNGGTPGAANNVCAGDPPAGEQGDVIVTEIMQNPSGISDTDGEFLELYNTTAAAIDIEGWTLSDLGSDSHTIDNGGFGVVIPAGGYAVLCRNGDPSVNGGITADYEYGSSGGSFLLANGDDEVILTDDTGAKQDEALYDGGAVWPDPNGASMAFDPSVSQDATANNDGLNWCEGTSPYEPTFGNLGTPGTPNEVCP